MVVRCVFCRPPQCLALGFVPEAGTAGFPQGAPGNERREGT